MRTIAAGLVSLGLAAGSCVSPPHPGERAEPIAAPKPEPVAPAPVVAEPEPEPEPLPAGPVVSEQSRAAHARAQGKMLRRGERLPALHPVPEPDLAVEAPPAVGLADRAVSDSEPAAGPVGSTAESKAGEPAPESDGTPAPMPGWFVPVTEPQQGEALASFHAALQRLRAGEDPDGKVRVAMYGASGTAADLAVGYVRTYLQERFGDGGPGFVPLVPLSRWYRHNEVKVTASKGWRKEHAQISSGRKDGHYGLLGASFSATAGKRWAQVDPKDKSFSCDALADVELYYLRQPEGGSFRARIDEGPWQRVSTAADDYGPGYLPLRVEPGRHTVRVETLGEAEVRVFGVVLERPEPGVVVDVLGIDGTRGRNHLTWNASLWADNLQHRAPDLYTLSYGTNESVDEDLSITLYAEDLRAQLRRFAQVLPRASCLLLGPVDFPILEGDQVLPRPQLQQIIEVQRQVAAEEGCGFWDGIAFMGGELSMPTWVNAEPALARKDHLHFTRWGAARKGMALADALMHAFDARGMGQGL